jgi:hypothetical protein
MHKVFFLLIWLTAGPVLGYAQTKGLPPDWHGHWRGQLQLMKPQGLGQVYPMQLIIRPLDSARYQFTIIYGEGAQAQERPYELLVIDAAKGHYRVDEKNSILIDAQLMGNRLITWFNVGTSTLAITYERVGDTIVFEVLSTTDKPALKSGGKKQKNQRIPSVNSFLANGFQRAVLRQDPAGK